MHHCAWLVFVFLVEARHVGQAGLELLASSDLPASVSQSAGITGVSHGTWPLECVQCHLLCFQTTSPFLCLAVKDHNAFLPSMDWSCLYLLELGSSDHLQRGPWFPHKTECYSLI